MGTWIGRYAIVGGEAREDGPRLVEHLRLQDEQRVRLLVLADPVDERSAEFCEEVAAAVADLFVQESLSLTGGLLRALRQAHRNLAEWNGRSLREHRVAVGVTCVAVRGREATVAQAGPGLVYLAGPGGVRRLTTAGTPAARPLGSGDPVEPRFTAVALGPSRILALGSAAEDAAAPAAIARALDGDPDRALAALYALTRGVRDLAAALVAEVEGYEPPDPVPVGPAPVEAAPAATGPPPAPGGAGRPFPDRDPADGAAAAGRGRRRPWRGRRMPRLRRPRAAGAGPGLPGRWIAALAAAAVVLGALVLVCRPAPGVDWAALEARLAAAEAALAAADAAADDAVRRTHLEAALAALEEAGSIRGDDPRAAPLREAAEGRLNEINAVTEVSGLRRVLRFEGVLTAPVDPAALAFGGGWLWLLDGARGRVFVADPAGVREPVEVFRAGLVYGGATAGLPLAIAWDERGGRLLLIDNGRTLFSLEPGERPAPLPLRGAAELAAIDAIAAYDGALYVLDGGAGEVWRYLPAGTGFDSERAGLLGGAGFADARALAVDGDLFAIDGDRLRRFSRGAEREPPLRGIDRPLAAPAALAAGAGRGLVYAADRGGRRVVAAGARGEGFRRQYVHPGFLDLRGIALAPGGAEAYVLTGGAIDAFALGPAAP